MKKAFITLLALAACSPTMADWSKGVYYYNGVEEDKNPTAVNEGDSFKLMAGSVTKYTMDSFTMKDGQTMIVSHNPGNSKNVEDLIINNLNASNASITIDEGQTLTMYNFSGSISQIVVNGTFKFGKNWNTVANRQKVSGVNIVVNGTLTLGSAITGLDTFTLDADSMIGGTYNVGTDGIEKLTITLSDADAITAALATGNRYEKQLTATMWNAEKIESVVLGAEGYKNGGLLFQNNGKYYSSAVWSNNGQTVTFSDEVLLNLDTAYAVAKFNGATIDGLYAVVIPEPATATLSLLALAGLCARRRRA